MTLHMIMKSKISILKCSKVSLTSEKYDANMQICVYVSEQKCKKTI